MPGICPTVNVDIFALLIFRGSRPICDIFSVQMFSRESMYYVYGM